MQHTTLTVAACMLALGCTPTTPDPTKRTNGMKSMDDGGDESPPPDGAGDVDPHEDDDDRDDGPGDDEEQAAESPERCDLAEFSQSTPAWLTRIHGPREAPASTVEFLANTDNALFIAGTTGPRSEATPFLERRDLLGDLVWSIELDADLGSLQALDSDGEHLYVVFHDAVRRWTLDGERDEDWRVDGDGFEAISVGDTIGLIETVDGEVLHAERTRAYAVGKSWPLAVTHMRELASPERGIVGVAMASSPWGGWVLAGLTDVDIGEASLWFDHLPQGGGLSSGFPFGDHPTILELVTDELGLTVVGTKTEAPNLWVSRISAVDNGAEIWRREIRVCGDADALIGSVVSHADSLWGLGWVRTTPTEFQSEYAPILVNLSTEGELLSVEVIEMGGVDVDLLALAVDDAGASIGGQLLRPDGEYEAVVVHLSF